jgi:CheY-like chemotaxis protein
MNRLRRLDVIGAGAGTKAADMGERAKLGKVLLVEDETLISVLVAEALEEDGFEVRAVANAEEALDALNAGEAFDVLFTDINLPGMDGATLAETARQVRPGIAVVYASGRWTLLDRLRSLPHSAVLPKPYSLTRACNAVENLLGIQREARAAG